MRKVITLILITSILLTSVFYPTYVKADNSIKNTVKTTSKVTNNILLEPQYYKVLEQWRSLGIADSVQFNMTVPASEFLLNGGAYFLEFPKNKGYNGKAVYFKSGSEISFRVNVENDALYILALDYYPVDDSSENFEVSIKVNNNFQFYESRRIAFPYDWKYAKEVFDTDRYGNQILPRQIKIFKWYNEDVQDPMHLESSPLKFYLKKGWNIITISNIGEDAIVGDAYIKSEENIINYQQYLNQVSSDKAFDFFHSYDGEKIYSKNNLRTRIKAERDVNLSPYSVKYDLFNIVDGKSWNKSGEKVTWEINIEKDGYYNIALKGRQDLKVNRPVFRTLYIDGKIPFEEAKQIRFMFSTNWSNYVLSDEEGKPYKFYLTKGKHFITLEVNASPFKQVIEKTNEIIKEINNLSLDIRKLTGNNIDLYRDWTITDYIPDINDRLYNWEVQLKQELQYLNAIDKTQQDSMEATLIKMSITQLKKLREKPNDIPKRLTMLSEGSSSVLEYLSTLANSLEDNPFSVNKIYVYSGKVILPKPNVGLLTKLKDSIERFILSFYNNPYQMVANTGNEINIWVNRPRPYVELMQKMADNEFTTKTGYKVNFSIMPDEGKLILANAAGEQPDAALGISNWLPYELAIRGAVYDLRQFKDFDKFIRVFSAGAFLPYIIDDKVYGIPETQDFWVLFYRKDIFDKLNLPVPDNWNDVIKILPELQRYGMNFYAPIAGYGGFKPFMVTVPFIYQYNGQLYSSDGMSTAINSEEALKGIELMSELFTTYSLPMQVPNFYNHFRYGTLPIGISNFTTYVQLLTAAPEIKGLWDISLYPGVVNKNGEVERWAPGSAQSCVIFNKSNKKNETWEFLKWWMSTDTQIEFANNLRLSYGDEYLWNTANIEAFKKLPLDPKQKEVILEQWKWLKEVPKTPGSYMLEREISNIWNKIVFDGENPRSAIDDATIVVNREIRRKMEEFGYIKDSKVIKPYKIPTVEMVEGWMKNDKK